ncbi:hypothetical protein AJ80_08036 [Polytolypa hystricis UAMH7299]|uniref:Uncharacterized protein n=1 Tax=Polytolypa hystricis (strain UAMH7299) TaxID=1447883 RepID=A0A2B7XEB5_POLH7|nr:hypothetical protein AJ80_08036 [Polytolypa hystricis UAMH7299]
MNELGYFKNEDIVHSVCNEITNAKDLYFLSRVNKYFHAIVSPKVYKTLIARPFQVGTPALHEAAKQGWLALARRLLEHGAPANAYDFTQGTALHHAAANGNLAIAQLLIDYGANVNSPAKSGMMAIHAAAYAEQADTLQLLVQAGADMNAVATKNMTALNIVATSGNDELVKILVDSGADLEIDDVYGHSPLRNGVDEGHESVTRILLEHGAHPETRSITNSTILASAVQTGQTGIVKLLLDAGVRPELSNRWECAALLHVVCVRNKPLLRLLFEQGGADISGTSPVGLTALHEAIRSRDVSLVRLILDQHVSLASALHFPKLRWHQSLPFETRRMLRQLLVPFEQLTVGQERYESKPLYTAVQYGDDAGIVRLLLGRGVDINALDARGRTALHQTARDGQEASVQLLLSWGADVNARDRKGDTPLQIAGRHRRREVVQLLLRHGAELEKDGEQDGDTGSQLMVISPRSAA